MPRRSIRCIVDLDLHAVTAPGCWLPSKEDCYLSVSFFSQYKNTELLNSVFPIPVNEHFRFEKTYFTALEAEEVIELLEDELVVIELLQMSEYSDGAVHLATYTNNVRDFLYPFETYKLVFQARERDIFLDRTVAFPGISPKLEFSSKIVVKESYSDELDALEDAIDYHKNTLKRLRKAKLVKRRPRSCSPRRRRANSYSHVSSSGYGKITNRSPSPTLQQRIEDMNLTNDIDGRPPFVVRKLSDSLIGRIPVGLGPEQIAKSKPHNCVRTNKYKTVDFDEYYSLPGVKNRSPRPKSSLSRRSPSGVLYGFDPDDEVANLTSRGRSLPRKGDALSPNRRYRSPSPLRKTPSYSPPRSRRDLYDRVPNVRFSRDRSPDDIYYGRDVSPTDSLNSDDGNNRKRPRSNPNKALNTRRKTPSPGLDEVDSNRLPRTPKTNKSAKLPSARRPTGSPHTKLGKVNKPLISADRSSPRSKSPYGTGKKIPSDISRRPYASDTDTRKPSRHTARPYRSDIDTPRTRHNVGHPYDSPYGSDTETPRPRRRITSPYGSDIETPRPRRRITSPYGSDIETPRPRRRITSPYGSDTETPRPRRRITSPYGSDTETPRPRRRITSPYGSDTETPRPRRRITSPYGSDIETPRPHRRITSPYGSDDEITRPSRRLTSPVLSDTEIGIPYGRPYTDGKKTPRGATSPYDSLAKTGRPRRLAQSPYASDTETPRSGRRVKSPSADAKTPRTRKRAKSPFASGTETGRRHPRGKSPHAKNSETPGQDLLWDPRAMDPRSGGRRKSPLGSDLDFDFDKPYHRSRYSYPELSSDNQNRPYASDSALPSKLGRGRNSPDELDSFTGPRRRPYASDTERPGRDTHPIDLDEIIGRKRNPFIDDFDGPLESDRLPKRSPYDDFLGSDPHRHSHGPTTGKPSDFDRHSLDDNLDRPYRYGGYGSPFSGSGQLIPDLEKRTSGHEYRRLTKTLTEDLDVRRQQDRTGDYGPIAKSRFAQSPDSGLSDEFDRKVTLSDDVDDVGSITITEGSLDINVSDSDIDMDIPGGPVTREDKYKVSRSTKNKKTPWRQEKIGQKGEIEH